MSGLLGPGGIQSIIRPSGGGSACAIQANATTAPQDEDKKVKVASLPIVPPVGPAFSGDISKSPYAAADGCGLIS